MTINKDELKIVCPFCKQDTEIQDLDNQITVMTPGYIEGEVAEFDPLETCDKCNKNFRVPITIERIGDTLIVKNK